MEVTQDMADQNIQGGHPGVSEDLRAQRHESRTGSTYKAFLRNLMSVGNFPDESFAERAAVSVLCSLGQRVFSTEAKDLQAQLPLKLRELLQQCPLHEGKPPRKFGRDEFCQMVANDLGIDAQQAEPFIRSVILAVRAQVSEGEAEDFGNMLPNDIRELWARPS